MAPNLRAERSENGDFKARGLLFACLHGRTGCEQGEDHARDEHHAEGRRGDEEGAAGSKIPRMSALRTAMAATDVARRPFDRPTSTSAQAFGLAHAATTVRSP